MEAMQTALQRSVSRSFHDAVIIKIMIMSLLLGLALSTAAGREEEKKSAQKLFYCCLTSRGCVTLERIPHQITFLPFFLLLFSFEKV